MQILPLLNSSSQTSAEIGVTSATAQRQSALFASLLGGAQASGSTASSTASTTAPLASAASSAALDVTADPSEQDLMNLPLTTEDLAALHDDLKAQGFSDQELGAMQTRVQSESGMTWGDMMQEVKQKVASTKQSDSGETKSSDVSSEKKDESAAKGISNDDKVELLSLFGKLGFTPAEAQHLVDSLANGNTDAVFSAVDAKIAGLASDDTVSLSTSEMTALGRNMGLSDEAQQRLATLFDNSTAEQGLSGQGITSALALVKNELAAKLTQENKALAEFRQSASEVLTKAWQRESSQQNADRHQDDVARKAGQVVAMGAGKQDENEGVPSASKGGVNMLGDVPDAGKGLTGAKEASTSQAGASATTQATTTGQGQQSSTSASDQSSSDSAMAQHLATKHAAATSDGNNGGAAFANGQQGGNTGNGSSQMDQDGWGEFWNKVRVDKGSATGTSSSQSSLGQTMAAMDGVKADTATQAAAKTYDSALASRAAKQLETGLLRNLGQDAKQLTLKLNPEELGKLSVTLTVKDKEIKAVIAADSTDTATMLQDQAAHIKKTLEDQGFKVTKLEVQTGIAQDRQNSWQGSEQHNQAREQREAMDRMRSSWRLSQQGDNGGGSERTNLLPGVLSSASSGLDLFA